MDRELADFGWRPFFQAQLDCALGEDCRPVRVTAVHRDQIEVAGPGFDARIEPFRGDVSDEEDAATVGDWLILQGARPERASRRLERFSLFKRKVAGKERRVQLIAANVDTLFIVSSCNQEFNLARLERFLSLARTAEVFPVIVLTKADLAEDAHEYEAQVRAALPGVSVELINARDRDEAARLAAWCGRGQTIAMVGSSGVGKSTLVNSLMGEEAQETGAVRADDDRGRHTTSSRSLHRMATGGWLLDMPGMREIQLTEAGEGIDQVFAEIVELAEDCRFADCAHDTEPGCAVRAAIEEGRLDANVLERFQKLSQEEARNTESIAERRARGRRFGKMVREVTRDKRARGQE